MDYLIYLLNLTPAILINLALGVPVFYLCRKLAQKVFSAPRARQIATWISTVFFTILLYLGFIVLLLCYIMSEPTRDFDPVVWRDNQDVRPEMIDDLLDEKILEGQTKAGVVALLGPPHSGDSTQHWTYILGMSGAGLGFKFTDLHVDFRDDRVEKAFKIETME